MIGQIPNPERDPDGWYEYLLGVGAALAPARPSITCPRCGRTSYHPDDIAHGYCGACHDWTHGEVGGG